MAQENPLPEKSPEEAVLQQAVEAIRAEKFAEAREMLTGLLKTDQENPEYWVWLSAAMETHKERLYCLQTANQLDPTNQAAKRGLLLLGAITQENPAPFPMNHPRPWESRLKQLDVSPKKTMSPGLKIGIVVGVISLVLIGSLAGFNLMTRRPLVTQRVLGTPRPTVTPYATNSNQVVPKKNTALPLAALLSTPYTPTPIYAATPHGEAAGDSYKGAMRAYSSGQWENMALMMAQVATAQPGSADALYFIGEAYRLSGNYKEAIPYYNSAIAVNAKYAPSYLGRALAELGINPQKNVLEDLNKAVEIDRFYAGAYMERGLFYFRRGDLNAAQNDLEQAASLVDSPLVQVNLARILLAQQEPSAAVEAAKLANQMDVTMLESYLVLGMAYRANGQIDQAVEALDIYLQYQPDNAEAFAVLGAAYYSRGDFAIAEENLLQSLRINKNNPDAYFWLGQTYLALKDEKNALSNLLKARDMVPDSYEYAEGLAKAYMANGEFNNSYIAILKVEKSVNNPELRARFLYIRALSLEQLNQPEAALRDWMELASIPAEESNPEMIEVAAQRITALRTLTPTITATPTREPTLPPGTVRPSRTPRPTDTRVPTSTSPGQTTPTKKP